MKKRYSLLFLIWLLSFALCAQTYLVTGNVVDGQTAVGLEMASAVLLRPDSSQVTGVRTGSKGDFNIPVKQAGKYLLKISYIGYASVFRQVELSDKLPKNDVGTLKLFEDEHILGTATVTATAAKVEQVEDTTVFNASAYRVAEGSTLDALVEQLPGIEVEEDGTITWNGKPIKEFLVNGKDFFKGNKKLALENLPADWISRIKAYEKQSEYTEQTGIDDGEEYPVLDITTKRELNRTWIANADLGYGTEQLYQGKLFASFFTEVSRVSAYGSLGNAGGKSFGTRGGRNGAGETDSKSGGMDFNWNNGKEKREAGRLELGGNFDFGHSSTHLINQTNSETYYAGSSTNSYRAAHSLSNSSNTSLNSSFRLEWEPDTMTNINFRPTLNWSTGDNSGRNRTGTFNADPFELDGMLSPLDSLFLDAPDEDLLAIAVNRNKRQNMGKRERLSMNGNLNVVRRIGTRGRNVSAGISGGFNTSENTSFSISDIRYYLNNDYKYLNQYSNVPSHQWNYAFRLGYAEPITDHLFAEVRYSFSSRYTDSERSRYNLDQIDPGEGDWGNPWEYPPLGSLPPDEVLELVRDSVNSQYATYRYYNHTGSFSLRYNTKAIRFSAGVNVNPEKTEMAYERPGQHIDTVIVRRVSKVSPQLNFRYRMDKRNYVEIKYRGNSSQPSMTDLLAVVDNSNPMNISMGNPGLQPSWRNTLDASFRGYNVERQQGMAAGLGFTLTKNSVSSLLVYDESTGVRYRRPKNINGNWNLRANYMFNTGIGEEKNFTVTTNTNFFFNNSVGFVSAFSSGGEQGENANSGDYSYYDAIFEAADVQKNTTKTLSMRERLNLSYRKDWLDVGVQGSVNYNHSRSNLRKQNDRDTWNYSYGLHTNLKFDFGFSFSSNFRVSSRRGYPNDKMNTDEFLWNAQLAYSFLKRKVATVSLQFYDILRQQSNTSHVVSATYRSDSWNNSIHSYAMLHFIYKFRQLSGKAKGKGKKGKR